MNDREPGREERQAAEIHQRFVGIAGDVSEPLVRAIETVGPRRFPDRGHVPLAHFLARAVVGQQLSTKAARSIWTRIEQAAAAAGISLPEFFDGDRHEVLRRCGVSRSKIRALGEIRTAHRDGRLDGEYLRRLDHAGITQELSSLWGVGQWTCDMVALFYCGCPDVWPRQDVTVQKTFSRLIGPRRKPEKWAARFTPHRSWLALYMWGLVDAVPDERD